MGEAEDAPVIEHLVISDYREKLPNNPVTLDEIQDEVIVPMPDGYGGTKVLPARAKFTTRWYGKGGVPLTKTKWYHVGDIVPIGSSKCSQWEIVEIQDYDSDGQSVEFRGLEYGQTPILGVHCDILLTEVNDAKS